MGSDGGDGDAEMQGAFIRGHPSDQQLCHRIFGGFDIKQFHERAAAEKGFRQAEKRQEKIESETPRFPANSLHFSGALAFSLGVYAFLQLHT